MSIPCTSLDQVRHHIDRLDRELVALVAQRGAYVAEAARFKKSAAEVPAPRRVEEVIAKVTGFAREMGANPRVVEATWRAMIAAFIEAEMAIHASFSSPPSQPVTEE